MLEYHPYTVVWEITWKCNAHCIHCGSDCISNEKQNRLSTEECLNVIHDLKRIGTRKVTLSGGDPLLREDFSVLAKAIKDAGMEVAFITNAIALDDEKIYEIAKLKPKAFSISIDAGEEWMHDYIRGSNGCYNHALETIIKLKSAGVEPSVVTTTHKLNFSQLSKLREILTVMEVQAWQIQYADCIGRMLPEMMITEAQFKKQAEFILETKKILKNKMFVTGADVTGYMTELSDNIGMKNWNGCQAGVRALGLGCDGTVRGCLSQQLNKFIEGNVRNRSLYEIWNDSKAFKYNRNFDIDTLGGYCRECKYAYICEGGCLRSASTAGDKRCCRFCLYKIEQSGFSDEYQSRIEFSKEEIKAIYNKIKPLPEEFYNLVV